MSETPFELRAELLDDFFAECDEQLSAVRAQLAAHEQDFSSATVGAAALETIYRNIHSLKGNAAIVGLARAEELAHAMEGLLRRLTRRELPPTAGSFDLLAHGTHRLQELIEAFRARQPLPVARELVAQLAAYAGGAATAAETRTNGTPPPEARDEGVASAVAARETGAAAGEIGGTRGEGTPPTANAAAAAGPLWRAAFEPSADLDRRGVNINSVRRRLGEIGDIVAAVPDVKPGGQVRFVFTVAVRQPPDDPAAWRADGIELAPAPAPESGGTVAPLVRAEGDLRSDERSHDQAHTDVRSDGRSHDSDLRAHERSHEPEHRAEERGHDESPLLPRHVVRVDLSRLDELMRIAGEMVIQRSRLQQQLARFGGADGLREVDVALGRSLRDLRAAIMRVRLVPVLEIFSRLPFVVRDLARDSGKKVRVELEGQDTEVDKYIVERLKEPLLHLVRNAISHGIEPPAERMAAGKPEEATLLLRAAASGDSVRIEVRDDGRGIDAPQVAARARAAGLALPEPLAAADVLRLICRPGFSTREQADRLAGRGVGMAVVDTTVRDLAGTLALATAPGQFTQFTLRLPLTLSIVEALVVGAGAQTCAVPRGCLEEIVSMPAAELRRINQTEVGPYRGALLPLVRLRTFFGHEPGDQPELPVLVVASEAGLTGLVVDRIHGQREVVVRPIRDPLLRVPGVTGATELGDGRPVLILDAPALTAGAGALRRTFAVAAAADAPERPGPASPAAPPLSATAP